jgi:hypothetical protein
MRAVSALDAASRSEIAARNFDVGIVRKLAAAQFPLCNAFKLGSVQIVRLDAALGCRAFRENALEGAPMHANDAGILADRHAELDRRALGASSTRFREG